MSQFPRTDIEPQVIQEIVQEVSRRLNQTNLSIVDFPVRLDHHIERIDPLLGLGVDDEVRMIGIYGDEGVGKSTIARAMFNLHRHRFEASSFLADVKATGGQDGLVKVQKILLHETLVDDSTWLGNTHEGSA